MARKTIWTDSILNSNLASGSTGISNLMQNVAVADTVGVTIARLILRIEYAPFMSNDTDGSQMVHLGIGMVSEDAFNASAVPDPGTAGEEPVGGWLFRETVSVMNKGTTMPHVALMRADIRSARKIDKGILVMIIENVGVENTSFAVREIGLIRCLCLLP